ncbi:hypothetical protein RBE51_18840 [Pseudomonas taiwanensis]|uniref:hypothetical protein n=1 Tax=Pseudomonas taiwanensis TaxID=470150 RepID=UPI0028DF0740|nr:hypothetical protein [Pseudomonas taiwanensis]MDT8924846.1 hypothetical protein [Pseudomonas taiwanensis]
MTRQRGGSTEGASPVILKMDAQEAAALRRSAEEQLGAFLSAASQRGFGHRATLMIPPFSVYVRAAMRPLDGVMRQTVDIATVENIVEPGRGALPILMTEVEKLALAARRAVYVESVQNEGLCGHLSRRGYRCREEGFTRSYYKTVEMLEMDLEAQGKNNSINL